MPIKVSQEAREQVVKLQQLQQQLQALMMQKQNFQIQESEIDNAMTEASKSMPDTDLYEIVGNIMVKKSKEELKKSLNDKKEITTLRIKSLDKQINSLDGRAKELQKEIMTYAEKEEEKK